MSLKKFIQHVWAEIAKLWHKLDNEAKVLVPVVIKLVDNIRKFVDSPVADVLTVVIPGDIDDKLKAELRVIIPKVLLELNMVDAIANITDPNEQLKAIIARLKLSGVHAQDIFWHGLASKFLELSSDGKFSWNDSIALADYFFKNKPQ